MYLVNYKTSSKNRGNKFKMMIFDIHNQVEIKQIYGTEIINQFN